MSREIARVIKTQPCFLCNLDESCITNGYLDKPIEWIPGMKDIRLKDLPSFIRTTRLSDFMLNFEMEEASKAIRSHPIILNTWDDF